MNRFLVTIGLAIAAMAQTDAPTPAEALDMTRILPEDIPLKCGLPDNAKYTQYSTMNPPLCVVVGDEDNGSQKYTAFYPVVDDFTLLEVNNSYAEDWLDAGAGGKAKFVRVEVGGVTSTWRRRTKGFGTNPLVVPFWTVILELDKGVVKRVTWDDGCFGCEQSECVDNHACAVPQGNCDTKKADCDLKIYASWFGTDSTDHYLTSAGKRLSRFRGTSLKGAFDTAIKQAVDVGAQVGLA